MQSALYFYFDLQLCWLDWPPTTNFRKVFPENPKVGYLRKTLMSSLHGSVFDPCRDIFMVQLSQNCIVKFHSPKG